MAEKMRTGTVNRKDLIAALGGNALVARHVEDLTNDVTQTLPDQAAAALAAAGAAQDSADDALSRADALGLGVFGRRPAAPLSVRPGDLIRITPDAGGFLVDVDLAQLAVAVAMVMPRPRPPATIPPPDDAQAILAARTFNRK